MNLGLAVAKWRDRVKERSPKFRSLSREGLYSNISAHRIVWHIYIIYNLVDDSQGPLYFVL